MSYKNLSCELESEQNFLYYMCKIVNTKYYILWQIIMHLQKMVNLY